MPRIGICLGMLLIVIGSVSPLTAGELLRWKWRVGDQLQIEVKQTSDQKTTLSDREMTFSGTQRLVMVWTVDDINAEDEARLTLTVKRLQLNLNLGELGKVDFDSDVQQEPAGLTRTLAGPLRTLLGAKITQVVTSAGEVKETVLPDATRQSLDAHPLARRIVQRLFADIARQSSLKLPVEELELNQEWQNAGKLTTELGEVPVVTTYKYRGKTAKSTGDLDMIDVTFRLGPDSAELTAKSPLKIIEQESRGTIWFDNGAGRLASAHFDQQQTLDVGMDEQRVVQTLNKVTDLTIAPYVPPQAPAEALPAN